MTTGNVELTILDGGAGAVNVPASTVMVVVGTSSSGTANTVYASRNANSLVSSAGYGPAPDQCGMIIGSGGTVLFVKAATTTAGVASAVTAFATGTSVVTVSGAPYDAYLVKMLVTAGGTRGTAGIKFKLSLDAGRTYGPEISLGTATTYAMTGTGLTLSFAAGTMVTGESVTFGCTEPLASNASISAALSAFAVSPYANLGAFSVRIVGPRSGSDLALVQGYLEGLVTNQLFTRGICEVRDVHLPSAYGGDGESSATWITSVQTDMSALSAKRVCAAVGNYNMPSSFSVACAGQPILRRNLAYAVACRQVRIKPQNHAGRVSDGGLEKIAIDPVNDANDGFYYHDDEDTPSFNDARLMAARKRKKRQGYFVVNPNLGSASGSVFKLLPHGLVTDIASAIVQVKAEAEINSDVPLNRDGTLTSQAAQAIERSIYGALKDQMLSKNMLSAATVTVDTTNNVRTTSIVNIGVTLESRGYILEIDASIQLK